MLVALELRHGHEMTRKGELKGVYEAVDGQKE
jgi:hypothetical protein